MSNNSDYAIKAENLTRRYGYRVALKKVSFVIEKNGIHGLFGANGAGKTTLMRIITTLLRPHGGTIRVMGYNPEEESVELRAQLGLVGDKPLLYPELSGRENLHFFGKLYGIDRNVIDARAIELAERFQVKKWIDEPTKNLSTGLRKRIDIIRSAINNPELYLLDEPYSGLDTESSDIFSEYLEEYRNNRTTILTTHNLQRGSAICDTFLTLKKGQVAGQGPIGQFDSTL
ncbi:MAG: ABC transporter ATP-binding protein [Candidatus Thorarchaeota archaeon]